MSRTNKRDYTGSKRFDRSCRNHGGCDYCASNRMRQDQCVRTAADEELKRWLVFGDNDVGRDECDDPVDWDWEQAVDLEEAEARVTEDLCAAAEERPGLRLVLELADFDPKQVHASYKKYYKDNPWT